MLQVIKKLILFSLILFISFLFIQPALAQEGGRWGAGLWEGRGVFVEAPGGLLDIFVNVVMWMMSIIALLALGFIVYGAIRYVTSAGNEKQVEEAKKILLYAIIGLVVAVLAVVIIQLVARVIERGEREVACCKITGNNNACNSGNCSDPNNQVICNVRDEQGNLGNICKTYFCAKGQTCEGHPPDCTCVTPTSPITR